MANQSGKDRDLIDIVFSWKLTDILNHKLYKDWVKEVPRTFASLDQYTASFIAPLLEETRAELHSNMDHLSQQPVCEILLADKRSMDEPDNKLRYHLIIQPLKHSPTSYPSESDYSPKTRDLLAITSVRPKSIGDLLRNDRPYTLALVTQSDEDEEGPKYPVEVRTTKTISISEEMRRKKETLYAVVLANLTTGSRIWACLNMDKVKQSQCGTMKIALYNGPSTPDNCSCWSNTYGADLSKFNLNDSQTDAILSCLSGRKCSHQNTVKLIWGPPGTGKTKTVSTLLWTLLALRCRTVTCAPTNVAVVQIASRLLSLLQERVPSDCNLGDVVLFGNEEKMQIKEEDLKEIYLKYRVDQLAKCFALLTGWNHQLAEMKALLEDCFSGYKHYLDDVKKKSEGKIDCEDREDEGRSEEDFMTFKWYLKKRLVAISSTLKQYIMILSEHLPSHMVTSMVVDLFNKLISLIKSLQDWLFSFYTADSDVEVVYKISVKVKDEALTEMNMLTSDQAVLFELCLNKGQWYMFQLEKEEEEDIEITLSLTDICGSWYDSTTRAVWKTRLECLHTVSALQKVLNVPNTTDKRSIQDFCLKNATLILCTASSSFRLRSLEMQPVELLIIDEAAQLKECESLIPMQISGLKHVILIGDECQLPAVVMSEVSKKACYGRSLFERLVSLGHEKHLLNVQYRMHPSISMFPNVMFYNNQIRDGENVKSKSYERHFLERQLYGPYSFINIASATENSDYKHSLTNILEVDAISLIVENLYEAFRKSKQTLSIGVISPYKAQVTALSKKLGTKYKKHKGFSVKVKSVDGFQGGEEDVIIMSTVRSNMRGSIGFLSNPQRTNVALTRAKHCLWILGSGTTLVHSGSIWKALVINAKNRGCFFDADMDENLAKAVGTLNIQMEDHMEDMLSADSPLFSNTKWKVLFTDDFRKSFGSIKRAQIRNEMIELVKKLANGYRPRNRELKDGGSRTNSMNLLKQYNLQGQALFWTVEVCKASNDSNYIQVLKFWDTLPSEKASTLVKGLENMFEKYSEDYLSRCRFRCLDGDVEVPMCWPSGGNVFHPTARASDLGEEDLARHLASLNLGTNASSSSIPELGELAAHQSSPPATGNALIRGPGTNASSSSIPESRELAAHQSSTPATGNALICGPETNASSSSIPESGELAAHQSSSSATGNALIRGQGIKSELMLFEPNDARTNASSSSIPKSGELAAHQSSPPATGNALIRGPGTNASSSSIPESGELAAHQSSPPATGNALIRGPGTNASSSSIPELGELAAHQSSPPATGNALIRDRGPNASSFSIPESGELAAQQPSSPATGNALIRDRGTNASSSSTPIRSWLYTPSSLFAALTTFKPQFKDYLNRCGMQHR